LAQCPITIPFTHTHTELNIRSSFLFLRLTQLPLLWLTSIVRSSQGEGQIRWTAISDKRKKKEKKNHFCSYYPLPKCDQKKKIRVKKDASNVERKVEIKMFCVFDMLSGPKSYNLTSLSFLHFVCVKRLQQVLPQKHSISNANRRGSGEGVRAHIHNLQKNTCFT
jgi:hypothetical protein